MNDEKILELVKAHKALKANSAEALQHRDLIFKTILETPDIKKALRNNTWFRSFNGDTGECVSTIYLGILKAIDQFDLKKRSGKFSSFLWTIINRELADHFAHRFGRKGQKKQVESSIEDSELKSIEMAEDLENMIGNRYMVEDILAHSTPDEKAVLERILKGYNYAEIGAETNFGNYKIWSILDRVRKRYQTEGPI